jgi:two-component system, cell cycle sensor histidine kinase PleC
MSPKSIPDSVKQSMSPVVTSRRNDEDRIGQRRRLGRNIQSVRERLTSASGLERSFDSELIRQFARKSTGASGAILATLTILVGLIATVWIPAQLMAMWASAALVICALQYLLARNILRRLESADSVSPDLMIMITALQTLVWSGLVLMFLGAGEPAARVFMVGSLMFFGLVVVLGAYTVPGAVYMAIIPLLMALASLLWINRDVGTMTIASVGLVSQIFFLFLANGLYSQAVATLEFRAEKDILIADLETATINSEDARRKAEEANLAKSKFLATMSHELRTPLNAILGFSEVMKNEVFGPHAAPPYREYSSDIHASGQHLLNLINEILDLSRIEAGRYELKEEAINLAHIADECLHMLTLRARGKSQTIRQAVEPDLPKIWADERAMRQIILNLLSNALKFTQQGGDIMLKVGWTAKGGQYVSITDNGPGIPENELTSVLSSFGRGSQAIKTAEEGSGLGLAIVKGLVEMHGGVFTLKSKLRVGTEVSFTVPPVRVMSTLAAIKPVEHRLA